MNYDLNNITPKDLEKLIAFLQNLLGLKYSDKSTISKVVNQENDTIKCPYCHQEDCIIKSGFTKNKIQRYKCKECNKKFVNCTKNIMLP